MPVFVKWNILILLCIYIQVQRILIEKKKDLRRYPGTIFVTCPRSFSMHCSTCCVSEMNRASAMSTASAWSLNFFALSPNTWLSTIDLSNADSFTTSSALLYRSLVVASHSDTDKLVLYMSIVRTVTN